MQKIASSEITPEYLYFSRREFIKKTALYAGSLSVLSACNLIKAPGNSSNNLTLYKDEFGDLANTFEQITNYNNFYEFFTNKESVADLSKNLKTDPWKLEIKGLVNNPLELDLDDLSKLIDQEEKIYRLR